MIYEILPEGKENCISAKSLCDFLNISRQQLSRQVMKERRAGKPICASCGGAGCGYYRARDRREMLEFCKSLKHRSDQILITRRDCMKTARRLPTGGDADRGSGPG